MLQKAWHDAFADCSVARCRASLTSDQTLLYFRTSIATNHELRKQQRWSTIWKTTFRPTPPVAMFRGRYRNRGGSSSRGNRGGGSHAARPLKGLFADNIWHCNCTPRLPAERFKVKKEGKNQGRWFYTCQEKEPKRCDFFLWDEDAKPREEAAVLSGSRTEPMGRTSGGGEVQEGWNAGRGQAQQEGVTGGRGLFGQSVQQVNQRNGGTVREQNEETESPTPSPVTPAEPHRLPVANSGVKRNAQDAGIDDDYDEAFPWPLTGQEEKELASAADTAAPRPETPHKAQKTGVYATPATTAKRKLPWLDNPKQGNAPVTPAAAKPVDGYFDTPSKRTGAVSPIIETLPTSHAEPTPAAATTPSPPTRHKDALVNPADSSSSLTSEALAALQPASVPPDVLSSVRTILSKHDLKTQGILKGRDISRLAMKAKDAKIAELQAKIAGLENARIAELQTRIASLEADRELDKGVIRQLKWQVEHGQKDSADSQETIG